MKKGRHRRFEEARALKRLPDVTMESCPECLATGGEDHAPWCTRPVAEPCEECGAKDGAAHASWCLAWQDSDGDDLADGALARRAPEDGEPGGPAKL